MKTLIRPTPGMLLAGALLTISLLFMSTNILAANWTVISVEQLQFALTTSQNNGEDDTINVAAGFYDVSSAGLSFVAAENFALTIQGAGANDTTLDGGRSSGILKITATGFLAQITIRNISFWRGNDTVVPVEPGLSVKTVSALTIENSLFTRNSGGPAASITLTAGAMATLVNNIFSGNKAPGDGSALKIGVANGGIVILTNNSFIGNRSDANLSAAIMFTAGGNDDINIYNNIVWGEHDAEAGFLVQGQARTQVNVFNNIYRSLSFVGGTTGSLGDNLEDIDPLFVTSGHWDDNGTPADPTDDFWVGGNYHLQDSSPAKDSGLNSAPALPSTDFDFDGNPRISNLIVDRGAYEFTFSASPADIRITDSVGDASDLTIDFGNVFVPSTSSIETVTVVNDGDLPLSIGRVVAPSGPFLMRDGCSLSSLNQGVTCDIDVQFLPSTAGGFSDTLSIPSDDPDTPLVAVSVSGTGVTSPFTPDISVTPIGLFFNSIIAGNLSLPLEVTISNIGTAVLNVSGMSFDTGTDFSLDVNGGSSPCGSTMPTIIVGGNCTVSVTFGPQSTGIFFDRVSISSNDPGEPMPTVSLSGTGVSGPRPNLVVDPLSHDFLDVILGNPSAPLVLTLSNSDNFDVHVSAISFTSGTQFTLDVNGGTTPCGSTAPVITPPANCTVSVTFEPQFAGMLLDTLTIFSDDSTEPTVNISLTGGGVTGPTPDISVSPLKRDFSGDPFGSLTVTISNTGIADLHVTDIFLMKSSDLKTFTLIVDIGPNACLSTSPTITPGGSCTVEIEARLGFGLTHTDTLVINSDDWNESEVMVELSGTGAEFPNDDDETTCAIASMSSPEDGIPVVPIVFLLLLIQGLWVWRKMRRH